MIEIIKKISDWQNKTPAEIAESLAEIVSAPNMRGWTPKSILQEQRLLEEEVRLLISTMQADSLYWFIAAWFTMREEGIDFGSQERRSLIDQLSISGNWESIIPGMTNRVKALGQLTQAKWEQLGGSGLIPSVDAIAKALIVSECRDDMAAILQPIQAKSTALNAWLDSLDTSAKTVEEVQAYCDALLASTDGNPVEVP